MTETKKNILLIVYIIVLTSCKKNETHSHNFTVKNETKYTIESIKFQVGGTEKTFSIAPFSTSNTFNLTFEEVQTFPLSASYEISYFISSYSDSIKTYSNNIGGVYPQNKLNPDNKVKITLNPNGTGNNIFELTFN